MKLGIGTVQFGLDYGITNDNGKVIKKEASKILNLSAVNHIKILDTAASYGDSETVLGEILQPLHPFSIVTKTPLFRKEEITLTEITQLASQFQKSLSDLKQDSIYGLLVHHTNDLLAKNGHLLFDKMQEFKHTGQLKKIGISVYSREQIDKVLERFAIDIIQAPINVLDQRFLRNNYLSNLKKYGIEVHARSIFLQGLLAKPKSISKHCAHIEKHLHAFFADCVKSQLTPLQVALSFVMQQNEIDTALIGVTSCAELEEILHTLDTNVTGIDFSKYMIDDETIINPTFWPKN
jgi:aryl-alcohol dehydrogenase-like predicted oxidoreductase